MHYEYELIVRVRVRGCIILLRKYRSCPCRTRTTTYRSYAGLGAGVSMLLLDAPSCAFLYRWYNTTPSRNTYEYLTDLRHHVRTRLEQQKNKPLSENVKCLNYLGPRRVYHSGVLVPAGLLYDAFRKGLMFRVQSCEQQRLPVPPKTQRLRSSNSM